MGGRASAHSPSNGTGGPTRSRRLKRKGTPTSRGLLGLRCQRSRPVQALRRPSTPSKRPPAGCASLLDGRHHPACTPARRDTALVKQQPFPQTGGGPGFPGRLSCVRYANYCRTPAVKRPPQTSAPGSGRNQATCWVLQPRSVVSRCTRRVTPRVKRSRTLCREVHWSTDPARQPYLNPRPSRSLVRDQGRSAPTWPGRRRTPRCGPRGITCRASPGNLRCAPQHVERGVGVR